MQYVAFRSETSVTLMICVVWFLSALVSLPTLLYPPWRIPFEKPTDSKIHLQRTDKLFLDSLNVTQELAYQRCSVSVFMLYTSNIIANIKFPVNYFPIKLAFLWLSLYLLTNDDLFSR